MISVLASAIVGKLRANNCKYRKSFSVTAWGVTDSDSWKNDFPIRGRRDYPLLFDRNYQPKEFIQKMMDEQSDTTAIAQK